MSKGSDGRFLIHIGYHKTGTTTLQQIFFTEDFGFGPVFDHDAVSERITDCNDFAFDAGMTRDIALARAAVLKPDLTPVISSEILSGNPHRGGHQAREYGHRLAAMFPDARILITIREQKKLLASLYMQYLRRGGTKPVERYLREERVVGYATFSAENFCYDRLVAHYVELFGRDNVLVLTQEEMARDVRSFLGRIIAFSGARSPTELPASVPRIGEGFAESAAWLFRRLNHFRADAVSDEPIADLVTNRMLRGLGARTRSGFLRALFGDRRPVTDYVRRTFSGRFADSNRRLKALLGDDVDLTGYEL